MRKPPRAARKRLVYPKQSNGTKWAAENRKKASVLSPAERAALFKRGILRADLRALLLEAVNGPHHPMPIAYFEQLRKRVRVAHAE